MTEKSPEHTGSSSDKSISSVSSTGSHSSHHFLLPSPLPTKRNRTYSLTERAHSGPTLKGQVKNFCREKGHGFIQPSEGGDLVFVHISDIDGDFVLKEGDDVTYKLCPIPPKMEKFSAVHVRVVHPKEGVEHERWDGPSPHHSDDIHSQH